MASDEVGARQAGAGKPKAKVTPARNVVGVILLVAFAGAAALKFLTINRFNSAVHALDARIPKDSDDPNAKVAELPSKAEAETLLGRTPDGALQDAGGEQKATYTWQGLRKHVLTAYYTTGSKPNLIRIETGTGDAAK